MILSHEQLRVNGKRTDVVLYRFSFCGMFFHHNTSYFFKFQTATNCFPVYSLVFICNCGNQLYKRVCLCVCLSKSSRARFITDYQYILPRHSKHLSPAHRKTFIGYQRWIITQRKSYWLNYQAPINYNIKHFAWHGLGTENIVPNMIKSHMDDRQC